MHTNHTSVVLPRFTFQRLDVPPPPSGLGDRTPPPPPPAFLGTPKLFKEGENVACMRAKTPRFST